MDLARLILLSTHQNVITFLVVIGFVWINRRLFYSAICLIFLSMITNIALKVTFQIPLNPLLGKDEFAFPSGHMQCATVFYTWIAYKTQNMTFKCFLPLLLISIMMSLVYCGYHTYYDTIAGIFFGLFLLALYTRISSKEKTASWILFTATTLLIIYTSMRWKAPTHVWMAYYGLLGFMISEIKFHKPHISKALSNKIIESVFTLGSIAFLQWTFLHPFFRELPGCLSQLHWLMIGFIVPFSSTMAETLKKSSSKIATALNS